jgi:hypothetical protein
VDVPDMMKRKKGKLNVKLSYYHVVSGKSPREKTKEDISR